MIYYINLFFVLAFALSSAYFTPTAALSAKTVTSARERDESWDLLFKQNQLENEGKAFEESLQFELAKEKYRAAIEAGKRMTPLPDHLRPITFYARVLQKESRFEEALEKVLEVIEVAPKNDHLNDAKEELEVLIEARETESDFPIKEYIERFGAKYAAGLPPQSDGDLIRMTTILRIYDLIANFDAGIKFMDEIFMVLKRERQERGEDPSIYDRIKTSQQAEECASLHKKPKDRGPDSMECKLICDFLRVREGFERDKSDGRKSCIRVKPGEICMGRATKALIASDYFTW